MPDIVSLNPWSIVLGIAGGLFGGDRLQGRPLTDAEAGYNPTLTPSDADIVAAGDLTMAGGAASAGESPGLPPIVVPPPAPAAPEVPIVPDAGLPSAGSPPLAGPPGPATNAGQLAGLFPVVLASSGPSDKEWLERALKAAKGNYSALPSWAKRMVPRPRPTAAQRAARAARSLEGKVGQAVMRLGGAAIAGLGATGAAILTGIGGVFYPSATANDVPLEPMVLDPQVYRRLPVPKPPKPRVISYTRRTPPSVTKPVTSGGGELKRAPQIPTAPRQRAPASPPTAATTAPSSPTLPGPSSGPGPAARTIARALSNPAARNALTALDLLGLARRSSGPATVPSVPVTPLGAAPVPAIPTLTGSNPLVLSSPQTRTSTRSDQCSCSSKKRGKPRKCLERANVVWAGGRRKGKVAGSKCLRFE